MDDITIGSLVNIHSYKHNGKFHRSWDEFMYLGDDDDYKIFCCDISDVMESDGRKWKTKNPNIMFFTEKNWFNVIAEIKDSGIFYKCNIASPAILEENTIKYIDYDLDLKIFPNGSFKILDRGEYKYHKKLMGYSDDLDMVLKSELSVVISMVRNKQFPFCEEKVRSLYDKYLILKSKK